MLRKCPDYGEAVTSLHQDTGMKIRKEYDFKTDEERIKVLADLVEEGSQDPRIITFTKKLLNSKNVKSYDNIGEIMAIGNWVKDNITYRRHVLCRDSFQTPFRTMELGSADCDQAAVLVNSMLASVGIPSAFRIMSMDVDRPYHHIYSLAGLPISKPVKWIPIDTTQKNELMGWEPKWAKKQDWLVICK